MYFISQNFISLICYEKLGYLDNIKIDNNSNNKIYVFCSYWIFMLFLFHLYTLVSYIIIKKTTRIKKMKF
jgi:hypothetical protein